MKLAASWCEDSDKHGFENSVYMPDKFCECGIDKHHYHCSVCGKVTQIG